MPNTNTPLVFANGLIDEDLVVPLQTKTRWAEAKTHRARHLHYSAVPTPPTYILCDPDLSCSFFFLPARLPCLPLLVFLLLPCLLSVTRLRRPSIWYVSAIATPRFVLRSYLLLHHMLCKYARFGYTVLSLDLLCWWFKLLAGKTCF